MNPPFARDAMCVQCRYYRSIDDHHGARHRHPPQFSGEVSAKEIHRWRSPLVGAHAWCGEFRPRIDTGAQDAELVTGETDGTAA